MELSPSLLRRLRIFSRVKFARPTLCLAAAWLCSAGKTSFRPCHASVLPGSAPNAAGKPVSDSRNAFSTLDSRASEERGEAGRECGPEGFSSFHPSSAFGPSMLYLVRSHFLSFHRVGRVGLIESGCRSQTNSVFENAASNRRAALTNTNRPASSNLNRQSSQRYE